MKDKDYKKIIEFLGKERVKINEPMTKQTTFKIGGPADLYYEAKTQKELTNSILLARKLKIPYFILGNGSNLLVSDKGFRGIVIKNKNEKIEIKNENLKFKVIVGAGWDLGILINKLAQNSIGGLEFMTGIPATVGGAVRGNAGAWQQNIGDKVSRVEILTESGQTSWLNQKDCHFSYRESQFKKNTKIILEVEFLLEKKDKDKIEKEINEILIKRKNQPSKPSAGCIFTNPKPDLAGKLIEECGLKGVKIGCAQISPKHANFIVNLGRAKMADVVALITLIREKVRQKFGIELEEEIVRIGEF